ncbi:MAG TPA: NAD(P)H-hydrate epimerase [Thermomicrobiales bacterium]|nr:NAD(P)H-hydrate epimerase [Thermomicrobiales bacterium]
MEPISVARMVEVDRLMVAEYGIALLQMMENAGRGVAAVARALLGGSAAGRRVVVLAGKGNNGGGGLAAARHLANAGAAVAVALSAAPAALGAVPARQRRTLARMGVPGSEREATADALPALLARADLVVDALIGYRLRGAPRAPVAAFIRAANAAPAPRLALDLPSGLDGDRGIPADPTVRADATVTLAWPKAGLLAPAARPVVGRLYLVDIGVPAGVYRAVGVEPGALFARGPLVRIRVTDGGRAVAAGAPADEGPP